MVHPIDRVAHQIEIFGSLTDGDNEFPNSELTRPARLGLPSLEVLGHDLLETKSRTRAWWLLRPFLVMGLYVALFRQGLWPLALLCVPFVYLTSGAALHDLLHKSLGVPRSVHNLALAIMGGIILESGHTLQATHQVHHRKLHTPIDPEGYVEGYTGWRVLFEGPFYKHYLACWVLRNRPAVRSWVLLEALWVNTTILMAVLVGWRFPMFGAYIGTLALGSWLFPFAGVHLVHSKPDGDVLTGTRTVRGRLFSRLGCGLTYHLEHHLYPRVPGHQLHRLSDRLQPALTKAGVEPTQLV